MGQNWWKLELDEKGKLVYMRFFLPISWARKYEHRHAKNWTSEIGGNWWKMGENGWKWVKMGENGRKLGENWVKIGENWKFHFYAFLVIFCHFGWFQAILVHFVPFVKGVEPFLKGDGQLVKGADRLKLLSKLAVFPLLLIWNIPNEIDRSSLKCFWIPKNVVHFQSVLNDSNVVL